MILACVWQGPRYGPEYVRRLLRGGLRHMPRGTTTAILTDRSLEARHRFPESLIVDTYPLLLPGWWGKMALFNHGWRQNVPAVYIDLDNVVVGDLSPLAAVAERMPFAVCSNFTRALQPDYPCRYGSTVMTFGANWGTEVWLEFWEHRGRLMDLYRKGGDQRAVEALIPDAPLLQDLLLPGFFLHYRLLKQYSTRPPTTASVVVFGGRDKPHNCTVPWALEAWAGEEHNGVEHRAIHQPLVSGE